MKFIFLLFLCVLSAFGQERVGGGGSASFTAIPGQTNTGNIVINGSTSGKITLTRPTTITDNSIEWWNAGPASGEFLRWDGTRLDWQAIAGGGDVLAANYGSEWLAFGPQVRSNLNTVFFWDFQAATPDKGLIGGIRNPDALAGSYINFFLGLPDTTNGFTVRWHGMLPPSGITTNFALFALGPNPVGASSNSLFAYINSDGRLAVGISGATISDTRIRTNSGTALLSNTNYANQVVNLYVGRDETGTPFAYVGDNQTVISLGNDTTAGTPPAWTAPFSITNMNIGAALTNETWFGRLYNFEPYNYALSVGESFTNSIRGPQSYQEPGSTAAKYTQNTSAGVDSWNGSGATIVGDVDGIDSVNDTFAIRPSAAGSAKIATRQLSSIPVGKHVTVQFDFYNPSTNVATFGVALNNMTAGILKGATNNTRDAWTPYTFTFTRTDVTAAWLRINLLTNGTGQSWTGNDADRLFIKNFRVYQAGVIARPDFEHADPRLSSIVRGRTTNGFTGTLVGASLEQINRYPQVVTDWLIATNTDLGVMTATNAMVRQALFATNAITTGTLNASTNVNAGFIFATNGLSVTSGSITGAYDTAHSGNVFKSKGYIHLGGFNNIGTSISVLNTNDMTTNNFMQPMFSGTADEAQNYIQWQITVPEDWDTSVEPRAKLYFRLNAADTGTHRYVLSMNSVVASSQYTATPGTAINLDFAGDASGAAFDNEAVGMTTLTGWGSGVTAGGRHWIIRLARDGDAGGGADASTIESMFSQLVIEYGKTQ